MQRIRGRSFDSCSVSVEFVKTSQHVPLIKSHAKQAVAEGVAAGAEVRQHQRSQLSPKLQQRQQSRWRWQRQRLHFSQPEGSL